MATPARRQYLRIKQEHPDALLLYQMGDFYETFDEDAKIAARELQITLTSREFGPSERVPLAGIPCHALPAYLAKLLAKGYRVAICQQTGESGRGLVERAVVRIATPGTVLDPELLPVKANNHLAAVLRGKDGVGLAYVDVSTGEFQVTELTGPEAISALHDELQRLHPAECLIPRAMAGLWPPPDFALPLPITVREDWLFTLDQARDRLYRAFAVRSLEGFGCAGMPLAVGAAGAIVSYLERVNPAGLAGLTGMSTYRTEAFLQLDAVARRTLELTETVRGREARGSLLYVLDRTRTPMGGRALRRSLGQPLRDRAALEHRLDAVAELIDDSALRVRLGHLLQRIVDLERVASRIRQRTVVPRELLSLRAMLDTAADLQLALAAVQAERLRSVHDSIDCLPGVVSLIARAVAEDGRLIKAGFDPRLDEVLGEVTRARRRLAELEAAERERTGIKSLKVRYNKVFGYYIEVSRPNLARVPAHYWRKQTMAGGERFISEELKQLETVLLDAEERIAGLERAVYASLLQRLDQDVPRLLAIARAIAELDTYLSLAEVAVERGYNRPALEESGELEIIAGRHPVVEASMPAATFVANDCRLTAQDGSVIVLTGPNMSGKSTFLRQVALIVLLAQIGSFVPAARVRIGLVDRIFTRVGAQDNISAGQSTFLVEMSETASVLRHATPRSLVVLDEVGRGTGLGDGLAIARAVVEDLHDRLGARTLFATHFTELAALEQERPGVRGLHVAVTREHGELIFLHRIVPGVATASHGLEVARLAGIPPAVLRRADELCRGWSQHNGNGAGSHLPGPRPANGDRPSVQQLVLVGYEELVASADELLRELLCCDATEMTPWEALNRLIELQNRARRLRC